MLGLDGKTDMVMKAADVRRSGVATSGHVIKMVLTPFDTPWPINLLDENFTALSSIRPELLLIEVLHCGNSNADAVL